MNNAFADLTWLGVTALDSNTFAIAQRGGNSTVAKENQEGLVYYTWTPGAFTVKDEQFGGTLTSAPALAGNTADGLHFAARGLNQNIFYKRGAHFGGWEECAAGGVATSRPAICLVGDTIHVYVRGQNDQLWRTRRKINQPGWTAWEGVNNGIPSLGVGMKSAPSVAVIGNRIDIVAQGKDDAVWQLVWNGSAWSKWEPLFGTIKGAPTCCWWNFGPTFHIFGRGSNDQIWHKVFTTTSASGEGNWTDWYQDVPAAPVVLQSAPLVVSSADQRVDIFAMGGGAEAWTTRWTPATGWQKWQPIKVTGVFYPAVAA